MKVCIVGASGKLGRYLIQHCLDRKYEVHAVCRRKSVAKLEKFKNQIEIFPGPTDDKAVIANAMKGCAAAFVVLVPWGVNDYASGTASAVLASASQDIRLVFSCGWHVRFSEQDQYGWQINYLVPVIGKVAKWFRLVDIDNQVEAAKLIFKSNAKWTLVRGSDLQEGESEGLPVFADHVGHPRLASNHTNRIDFALFMIEALQKPNLIGKAPAIVSCISTSAKQNPGS